MALDFTYLEPLIRQILSAPGTDLSTITAKRVRRQLPDLDPALSFEYLKDNKDAVDAVIANVYEEYSVSPGDAEDNHYAEPQEEKPPKSRKRKQEEEGSANGYDANTPRDGSPVPTKKPKKSAKNGRELSDAELARKLSSEINTPNTRTSGRGAKKIGRAKKSAATVDSDDSDDGSKKRAKKSSSAKGGFAKQYTLSEPLAAVLQIDKLPRPQVVKYLWDYIKGNALQNPENKRQIMCDDGLKAVFGVDKIDMFKMNKVLGQHLHDENEH